MLMAVVLVILVTSILVDPGVVDVPLVMLLWWKVLRVNLPLAWPPVRRPWVRILLKKIRLLEATKIPLVAAQWLKMSPVIAPTLAPPTP